MRTLRAKIFKGTAFVAGGAIAISSTILVLLAHDHLHHQSDALISQLARLEVSMMIEEAHFHLHEMNIAIPGPGPETERFAVIFGTDGDILVRTANLSMVEVVPDDMIAIARSGDTKAQHIDTLLEESLRMVVLPCPVQDELLYLAVGVRTDAIDIATRRVVVWGTFSALLGFLAVSASGYWVARGIASELERVHRATAAIDLREGLIRGQSSPCEFLPSEGATREIRDLATTIIDLLERVREMCDTQNRFLAEAAHELRTPLTAIRGELELALRRERSGQAYRETLTFVLEDTIRLQELATVLLDSAGARARPAVCEFGLAELVSEALRRHRTLLEAADITCGFDIDPQLEIRANRMATTRVLDNLIANAAHWSGCSRLLVSARVEEGWVRLAIADDGAGLPDALLPDLFTPFNRGDRRQGHGLGLYLAHTLMVAQGSTLDYRPGWLEGYPGATWLLGFAQAHHPKSQATHRSIPVSI